MSEIFDALRRAESSTPGAGTLDPKHAVDVLRRVEALTQQEREHVPNVALPSSEIGNEFERLLRQPSGSDAHGRAHGTTGIVVPPADFQNISSIATTEGHLACVADPESPAAEAFRLLGVRLRNLRETRALQRILVTSTVPREGKSMVTGNLACTLARSGRTRTLLLEGDIRRPTQSANFGLRRLPGLCEWLEGKCGLNESIYHLDPLGFWILPAGESTLNPLELLQAGKLSSLMHQLSEWFDLILIDSPPVLPLADTSLWMKLSDGILLVTRQGVTEKKPLQRGLDAIDPKLLLGAVMNSSSNASPADYYYRKSSAAE